MDDAIGNNDECATNSIPTNVTNSPTSLSTADVHVPVFRATTVPESDNGIIGTSTGTTTGCNTGTATSVCSDSNTDTTSSVGRSTATGTRSTRSDCPIRASGQVCICDSCETLRSRLILLRSKQRNDNSTNKKDHNLAIDLDISLNKRTRNKRSREGNKYAADEETDDNDDVDHVDTNDTDVTMAVTEVVTIAPTDINKNIIVNNKDLDTEQQQLQIMSYACRTILQCIGEDPDREGLQKTPERWAKALLFLCHGYQLSPSQVTNDAVFHENHNEMVVVRNIDIHSLCEHHMVPFTGHVHIGYIPNGKIIGLSKLARLADLFARRLQVQERLTRQIADAILETITPLGVAVVMECTHYCMVMRGVQKTGAITTTSSVRGCFETNSKTRAEFFSILHGGGK